MSTQIKREPDLLQAWSLRELNDRVEHLHGRDQAQKTATCAQSVCKRQDYMKYHYCEVERLIGAQLKETNSDDILTNYVFPKNTPEYHEFHSRRTEAEANLIAFLQCIHATEDTLAHVVYFALNLNQLKPSRISIKAVCELLTPSPLQAEISAMLNNAELRHVAALVNHSKHRSVVGAAISVSFIEDEQSHGLKFEGFTYREHCYPQRWAIPFMKTSFDAMQEHMLRIGKALNAQLAI
ncbi:hypothetical protein [Variovorax sp. IB41]|uniref:hypothetical protein n=1 Tax=Variovorax sp. IB41 TaxID=2779370 RepID=UPI0018E7B8B7|nr:hypothetical protein [Variovorax sp. IB41]MBJ2157053.1 hypothetical protein [Variovorax sp. IB41]